VPPCASGLIDATAGRWKKWASISRSPANASARSSQSPAEDAAPTRIRQLTGFFDAEHRQRPKSPQEGRAARPTRNHYSSSLDFPLYTPARQIRLNHHARSRAPLAMFGFLSGSELLIVFLILLLLFGGSKLPSLCRGLDCQSRNSKKAAREMTIQAGGRRRSKATEAKKQDPHDSHSRSKLRYAAGVAEARRSLRAKAPEPGPASAVSMQNVGSGLLAIFTSESRSKKLASYIGHLTASPLRLRQIHFAWISSARPAERKPLFPGRRKPGLALTTYRQKLRGANGLFCGVLP